MAASEKKKKKRRKGPSLNDTGLKDSDLQEAERLHGLLFGALENAAEGLGKEIEVGDGFRRDVLGVDAGEEPAAEECERKPAWIDEEESEIQVKEGKAVSAAEYVAGLRAQHAKLNPGTDWAALPSEKKKRKNFDSELDSDVEEDEDEDHTRILRENDELVVKSKVRLPQGLIEVSRLKDGNADEPSSAVVRSVEFHRNGQILMTAGFDKRLRFFQIDGKKNPKIQSVFLDNFPVHKASFVPDGSKVVASSRRKMYVLYDLAHAKVEKVMPPVGRDEQSLESFEVSPDSKVVAFIGNEGYILLSSLGTKQLIGTLKMNGSVRSLAFANDGRQLLSCGGDGEVYCWDLSTRRCLYKIRDDGCVNNTALCVSPAANEYFSTGSSSGVVNVYKYQGLASGGAAAGPVKTLMNLTTAADTLKFNHDGQILAMCSRMKKDAVRLVHVPSFTVFSNWPTPKTGLQYVHSLDFSPGSGYLAAGNAAGKVLLFRLRHYEHA
ncbi:hypothetical protein SELMODRAFT_169308 [Selaginella moellendorffii]|uniref:U3 small nucleolar RNA-associated protein 18 homolog n=2 Tax=Selaginella moellendorffii TaxID=88036 RepID=D8R9Z7_SELML|nr:hypothetical protein SELMODRAFT_169308 [Selaginella moellendorffii]